MTFKRNNRVYKIEIERVDRWMCKVTVYKIFKNGKFAFVGKAFSNDIEYAANEIIK